MIGGWKWGGAGAGESCPIGWQAKTIRIVYGRKMDHFGSCFVNL